MQSDIPRLIGKFEVERELSRTRDGKEQGGMGRVFRAHLPGQRSVVLKVAREGRGAPLANEAIILSQLRHPNIVRVVAIEQQGQQAFYRKDFMDGEACWVMLLELVEGESLNSLQGLRPGQLAKIIRQVAAGLDYAHQRQVAHLDVKPANILVSRDLSRVVLTDWGTAEIINKQKPQGRQARYYTPEYVAPERAEGKPTDARNDVYSLGVTAFEVFTGKVPFKRTTSKETARAHMTDPIPEEPMSKLPPAIQAVLRKALAKDPADRYPSAGAFAAALESAVPKERSLARLALVFSTVVVALLIVAALGYLAIASNNSPETVAKGDAPTVLVLSPKSSVTATTNSPSTQGLVTPGPSSTIAPTNTPSPSETPVASAESAKTAAAATVTAVEAPVGTVVQAISYPAPVVLGPQQAASFSSPADAITLRWSLPQGLQADKDFFHVYIRVVDKPSLDVRHYTKDTSYQVPVHLFGQSSKLEWYVVPWRQTGSTPGDGAPAGPPSETRLLIWR